MSVVIWRIIKAKLACEKDVPQEWEGIDDETETQTQDVRRNGRPKPDAKKAS